MTSILIKVMVYDSVYTSVSDEVTGVISLFHCTDNTHVSLESMQKQDSRSNNCGVFAIAAANAIANSYNPSLKRRKCKSMWVYTFIVAVIPNSAALPSMSAFSLELYLPHLHLLVCLAFSIDFNTALLAEAIALLGTLLDKVHFLVASSHSLMAFYCTQIPR